MFERVLAVADPGAGSQPAVARAAMLAHRAGGILDLLICDYDEHLAGARFGDSEALRAGRERLLDTARERLEDIAAGLRAKGLTVRIDAIFHHPLHEGIVAHARRQGASLVVKDTHYHHVLKRTVFSNTDWELMRSSPTPLLLVKERDWAARPAVLAAVDPMHVGDKPARLDHQILRAGRDLVALVDGELTVVHCFPEAVPAAASAAGLAVPAPVDSGPISRSIEATHRAAVQRLLADYDVDESAVLLVPGEPRRQLVALAGERHADVVVTGAVSRSRLRRAFLGFTAQAILDRLPCDLLILPAGAR